MAACTVAAQLFGSNVSTLTIASLCHQILAHMAPFGEMVTILGRKIQQLEFC